MANTETIHPLDTKHPPPTRLKKSASFKLSATSFFTIFSSPLPTCKDELRERRNNGISLFRKNSLIEAKNAVKRRASIISATLKLNGNRRNGSNDLELLDLAEGIENTSEKFAKDCLKEIENINIDNKSFEEVQEDPPTPITSIEAEDYFSLQKSISTPVISRMASRDSPLKISTNTEHHYKCRFDSRYSWTNDKFERAFKTGNSPLVKNADSSVMLIESTQVDYYQTTSGFESCNDSPVSSDDECALATPSYTMEYWPSGDSKSLMIPNRRKSLFRMRTSRNEHIAPSTICKDTIDFNNDEIQTTNCGKSKRIDCLRRTTTIMSISSSESIASSASSSSSVLFRRRSEFQKREIKAITMWYQSVRKLMQQNSFRKSKTMQKCTEKDQAMARFIVSELYSTEKSFYQLLLFIRSNYMEPLHAASQSKNPLTRSNDVRSLFYCLPDLISLSEKLLDKLGAFMRDSKTSTICPGQAIGRIFKDLEQDFVVFVKYAVHYQCHMKSIRRASHCGMILKIDMESKNCKENNRLGLDDYLIAPFQRVPRYGLLIRDLSRHTDIPKHCTDGKGAISDLIFAQSIVDGLATAMDQVQQKFKSRFSTSIYSSFNLQSSSNLSTHELLSR